MALYTKRYLQEIADSVTLNESKHFSQRDMHPSTFDIFLCHSYLDKAVIKGLYVELIRQGLTVYVDWIVDPHLNRDNVTKDTAETVRKRLRSSHSLLLAFSTNSGLSKWVPWELGYVDGHRNNCAIVPVSDTDQQSYKRSEYLLLYPQLLKPGDHVQRNASAYVAESGNTYVGLAGWSKGSSPSYQYNNIF
jgi:hypothetical protein